MTDTSSDYKEIRIALVLYGGVALATYINGACRELYELVKASRGEESSYQEIVQDLQANVTIDIISGASAGGLNGVALAKALVLGTGFENLENFWVKEAQIQNLLNDPGEPQLDSLLNEKYYEKMLQEALGQLDSNTPRPRVKSLDLFVATTDLHGNGYMYPAFEGESIYTKNHQYVLAYHYPNGQGEGNKQFEEFRDQNDSLPKLWEACRATSAFPFAFPPLEIKRKGEEFSHYLSDGGVLNNKPFEQAIDAIALRPAGVYVDRVLFYVEPDPSFTKLDYGQLNIKRDPLPLDSVVAKTLLGIPRYESIGEDLKHLQMHNSSVSAHNKFAEEIETWFEEEYLEKADAVKPDRSGLKERAFETFRKRPDFRPYQALKQLQVRQSMARWLLGQNPELNSKIVEETLERMEDDNPENAKEYYRSFDVDFRVRRFYYLTRQLIEDIKSISGATKFGSFDLHNKEEPEQKLLKELLQQKEKLLGFASEALEIRHLVDSSLKEQNIYLKNDTLPYYLHEAAPLYHQRFQDLAERSKAVLQQIDTQLTANGHHEQAKYQLMADAFELRDSFMLPMSFNRSLGERDRVEVVPITPAEATFINVRQESKLAGESLHHFGGFFQEKWRKMDIMWGRLDAAEMIVKFLIERLPDDLRNGKKDEELLKEYLMPIQGKIFKKYEDEFPKIPTEDQDYRSFLEQTASGADFVGDQTIKDLPPGEVVPITLKTLGIAHRLVETLQAKRQNQPQLSVPYGWVAKGLGYVNRFANLGSALLFPSNDLVKFAVAILTLGALGWSIGLLAVNYSGFQDVAPATLFLSGLVLLIGVTVSAFYYRLTWKKTGFLAGTLIVLVSLAVIDVRYSDPVNTVFQNKVLASLALVGSAVVIAVGALAFNYLFNYLRRPRKSTS